VREYIILNPHAKDKSVPFELTGYQMVRGKYRKIIPGPDGFLVSRSTGVRFGMGPGGREVILTDAVTGEELLSDEEEYEARQAAETRAEQEAKARQVAETRAKTAETRAEQETMARQAAETRAEKEAKARQIAEAEMSRMKAEIARLRDGK